MTAVESLTRHVGWSVVNVENGGIFGTFDREAAAEDWAEKMRGYGNTVLVEEARVPDRDAQIRATVDVHPDAPFGELLGELRRLVENDDFCHASHTGLSDLVRRFARRMTIHRRLTRALKAEYDEHVRLRRAAESELRDIYAALEVDPWAKPAEVLAEVKRLRAENDWLSDELHMARDEADRRWDQAGDVRSEVMQAIYDAGVHTEVCDDDPVPDMVRTALAAVAARADASR